MTMPPVHSATPTAALSPDRSRRFRDGLFIGGLVVVGGSYVLLIAAVLGADLAYVTPRDLRAVFAKPEIMAALRLTLLTCTLSALFSVIVGTPLAYLLSRFRFRGRILVDLIVDIPIVLPPLVLGISLLILFHLRIGGWQLEEWLNTRLGWRVTHHVPAVVLAQWVAAGAYAVRTMRNTFDQMPPRTEQIARTLGCSRAQAFWHVALPQARRGLFSALTIAWARSLGEFGPILVFAGVTRNRTEVLSTTVFLELNAGEPNAAVAVSLVLVVIACLTLGMLRWIERGDRS
jgi:molybdate transport system permease protein